MGETRRNTRRRARPSIMQRGQRDMAALYMARLGAARAAYAPRCASRTLAASIAAGWRATRLSLLRSAFRAYLGRQNSSRGGASWRRLARRSARVGGWRRSEQQQQWTGRDICSLSCCIPIHLYCRISASASSRARVRVKALTASVVKMKWPGVNK